MATRRTPGIPLGFALALVACSGGGSSAPAAAGNAGAPSFGSGGLVAEPGSGGSSQSGAPSAPGGSASGGTATADGGTVASATGGATSSPGAAGASTTSGAGGGGANAKGGANGTTGGGGGNVTSAGAAGAGTSTPTEKVLADLPVARQEHAVVAAAGEIYVIGGYTGNVTDSVQAYDPAKNSWRDVKSFPARMNHGNAGVVADKIYVAGFYINNTMSTATTQNFSYDPKTDTWTEKSPLPTGTQRAASCVAIDAGMMYVIGGAREGKSVDSAARYDAATDQWEELPPLPERREHCAAGAIGGIVYVAGGRMDGITGVEPKTWAYDPTAKTWTEKASLAPARGGLGGAVLDGQLYVFGGEGNSAVSSGVFPNSNRYDPVANSWQNLAPMLVPRHGYGAAALDGRIYLPGGAIRQGAGASKDNSVFYFP